MGIRQSCPCWASGDGGQCSTCGEVQPEIDVAADVGDFLGDLLRGGDVRGARRVPAPDHGAARAGKLARVEALMNGSNPTTFHWCDELDAWVVKVRDLDDALRGDG